MSEATVESIKDVLLKESAEVSFVTLEETIGENVARFVSNPLISGILLNLGIIGLTVELWMPGHVAPGLGGIICFALFFWGHSIASAGAMLPLILFLAGVALILLEVFVVPGFGLTGLLGMGLTFAGVYLAFPDPHEAVKIVSVSIILTSMLLFAFITYFPGSKMFKRVTLSATISSRNGYIGSRQENIKYVGRTGVAITDLNPAGRIEIDGERIQVVSTGEFIAKGSKVKVTSDEGNVINVISV